MTPKLRGSGPEWGAKVKRGERVALWLDEPMPGVVIRRAEPAGNAGFGWFPASIRPYDMRLEFDWLGGEPLTEITFVVNLDHGWTARFRCGLVDSKVRVVDGPSFQPPTGGAELSSRYVRTLAPPVIYETMEHWLRNPWVAAWLGGSWVSLARSRPGRSGRDSLFYAQWAARYVAALDADSRAPIRRLIDAEQEAGRFVTDKQIRGYLYQARRRDLLTEAPEGRAGGALTAKAEQMLRDASIPGGIV